MIKKGADRTPQEKVAILKRHLVENVSISDLCDEYGLHPAVLHQWQGEFFENGAAAFEKCQGSGAVRVEKQAPEHGGQMEAFGAGDLPGMGDLPRKPMARQNAVLSGIARIFREALTCRTEEELGRICLAVAEELTQSRFSFLGEINHYTGKLDGIAVSNPGSEHCGVQDQSSCENGMSIGFALHSIYGRVLTGGRSFFINDPTSHPHSITTLEGLPLVTSFLGVPLIHGDRIIGMVGLGNGEGGYGPEDMEAVEALTPAIVQALLSKRTEEAFVRERDLLQAVFDNIPILLVVWDRRLQRFRLNRHAEKVLGWTTADANEGDFMSKVYPDPDYRAEVAAYMHSLGRNWCEWSCTTKDGRSIPIDWANIPLADDTMIGIGVDLRERKQMEQNLRQAKEAAEASNRAKTEFLANMSHEIRTPISGVMGVTNMALAESPDERQKELLGMIKSSARSLLGIIDDILDLSRIEEGKLDLVHEELDLMSLLKNVVGMFSFQTRTKGIGLYYGMSPDVPQSVVGDPGRLRQVLVNLVGNAVKFTEHGEVEIKVGRADDGENDDTMRLRFTVKDTGIGIPRDKREMLFESFSQLDGSTSKKYGGTGLGLAICKRLVEMMGGSIQCKSAPGRGSRFCFDIPLGKEPQNAAEIRPRQAIGDREDFRELKVLLAEDNEIIQMAVKFALEQAGAGVVTASDGKECLRSLEEGDFDVILMDVQMPEMDGMEATMRIRESDSGNRRIPIIALTASAMKGDRERFLKAGMDDYVSKPVENEDLYQVIRRVLAEKTSKNRAGGGGR